MGPLIKIGAAVAGRYYKKWKKDNEKVCKKCGTQVGKKDKFCKSCGANEIVTRKKFENPPPTEEDKRIAKEKRKRQAAKKKAKREQKAARRRARKREKVCSHMTNVYYCPSCNSEFQRKNSGGFFSSSPQRTYCGNCGEKVREYTQQEIEKAISEI